MRRLTGREYQQFSEALRDAFTPASLRRMLRFRLERNLDDIVLAGDMEELVFELIGAAEAEGWSDRLLRASRESNPGNPALLAFSQQFGLAPTNAPNRPELERLITATNSFLDVLAWRSKLGQLEGQVCRVEVATNRGPLNGTGFLLGPDVVMTNHHVVEPVILGERGQTTADGLSARRGDVVLRFDYKRLADGTTVNPGTEHRLADEWLIDASPPSKVDNEPEPKTGDPRPDELDHALLRLAAPAGDEPVGAAEPGGQPRGWVAIPERPHAFAAGGALFIVQHPAGDPLQLALDTEAVRGVNGNGTRVTYRTNTLGGSSGSPCFNPDWELVALHHSGDPNFDPAHKPDHNEGIPITAILDLLKQRQLGDVLGAQDP